MNWTIAPPGHNRPGQWTNAVTAAEIGEIRTWPTIRVGQIREQFGTPAGSMRVVGIVRAINTVRAFDLPGCATYGHQRATPQDRAANLTRPRIPSCDRNNHWTAE